MKMVVVTENGQIQGFAHGSKADHTARHTAQKDHAGLHLLPGRRCMKSTCQTSSRQLQMVKHSMVG